MDILSDAEYSETFRLRRPDLCGRAGPLILLGEADIGPILLLGVVGRGGRLICSGLVELGDGGPYSYSLVLGVCGRLEDGNGGTRDM